ncbi:MAG: nitrogenase component 1 [Lachnospirales bacterium]
MEHIIEVNKEILLPLSKVNNNRDIKIVNNVNSPGCHCPMHTALAICRNFKGLSTLVVGTSECTYYSRLVLNSKFADKKTVHYTYLMEEKDVVFGAREGIESAIDEMFKDGSEKILIIVTCIPALIGEDYENLFSDNRDDNIAVLDVAHYKRLGYKDGVHGTMKVIGDFLDIKEKENQINIFAEKVSGELEELIEIIKKQYIVKIFDLNSNIDVYSQITKGIYTIVCSHKFLYLAETLKNRIGLDYINLFDIYDTETLKTIYKQLENDLHIKINLEKEIELANGNGIKTHITTPSIVTLSVAYALNKQNFNIETVHIEELDIVENYWKDKVLETFDPYACFFGVKNIAGDFHFGHSMHDLTGPMNAYWFMDFQSAIGYERIKILNKKLKEVVPCL